jgi:hypothetical protein
MTDEADFPVILAELSDVVAACYRTFSRSDYLLATFLLTAMHEKSQIVEDGQVSHNHGFRMEYGTPEFDRMGLRRFTLGPYDGHVRPFESARTVQLDGMPVAIWRSKMTSSFDRNWIEVLPMAADLILEVTGASQEMRMVYRTRSSSRSAFLRIPPDAPTPSVSERGADLIDGKWLDRLPDPEAATLGFNPDLWR